MLPRRLSLIKNDWLSVIWVLGTDGRSLHEWSWVRNANPGRLSVAAPDPLLQRKMGKLSYLQLQHFQIRLRYCWRTHQCLKTCHWTSLCLEHPLGLIFEESCCHRRVRQQHSAPYEFYRKHLIALLRLIHCSFGEQLNILNITQREREELFSMPSFEKMNPDPLFSSICQFSFSFFIMLSSVASSVHLL